MSRPIKQQKEYTRKKCVKWKDDLTSSYGTAADNRSFKETPNSSLDDKKSPNAAIVEVKAILLLMLLFGSAGNHSLWEMLALLSSLGLATPTDSTCVKNRRINKKHLWKISKRHESPVILHHYAIKIKWIGIVEGRNNARRRKKWKKRIKHIP